MSFFSPVINLFKKLKFTHKFFLISAIFLIPIIYLSVNIILQRNIDIKTMEERHNGLLYLATLKPLAEHIAQTRGMTNAYLNGKHELNSRIENKTRIVDKELIILNEKDKLYGALFNTGNSVLKIQQQWEQLKLNAFTGEASNIFSNYTNLINDILALKLRVAESSSLLLAQDLDDFYMVESLVKRLPFITETIGKSRGLGAGIAVKKEASNKQFIKLSSFIENIKLKNILMAHGFSIIFENNAVLKNKLESILNAAQTATEKFILVTNNELLQTNTINIDSGDYFQLGTDAISTNLALYDAVLPLIDNSILVRTKSLKLERTISIFIDITILLIATYLFFGFYISLMQNINNIIKSVDKMANGDLTARIEEETNDELNMISQHLNKMAGRFQLLVSQVVSASNHVVAASLQTSSIATQTASGINNQNQQIEQVATAVEEMSATANEVASSTSNAAEETRKANDETTHGQAVVNEAIQTITILSNEMNNTRSVVQELETNSETIGTVVEVIRGIAEQTNLLALNAAIEAARAGEQGRGFAVVADEVRTLAGRTQESTQEINHIVENLQHGAQNAVNVIEQNVERTDKTTEQALNAGEALKTISLAVQNISNMNLQIATAAEEQTAVAEEISRNIENIHSIAIDTSKGSDESAQASQSMNDIAAELQALVSEFKIV
jgi:methyl-accepting chemotaxis protein